LGVEGPKGGEIKEKVEGTRLRQASKWFEAKAASPDVGTIHRKVSFEPAISLAIPKLGG
jgi:hypothetical protein